MSSESTAVAVIKPEAEAEKLPEVETLLVPAAILQAAEAICDPKGANAYQHGVYLHARDRRGRVIGTDGHRMFISSFAIEGKMPTWLNSGVLIQAEGLKPRLAMLAKANEAKVKLAHVKGTQRVQMSDVLGDVQFNLELVTATYPDYEKIVGPGSFVDLDEDGKARGGEWRPIGIGSGYLKQCGDIARLLDNGRPKDQREKTGMVVRAFTGDPTKPIVFDFPGWPGAILLVMPVKMSNPALSKETAALIAPAVKGSIAALKAHSTRWLQVAKEATTDEARAEAIAKSKTFQDRIRALMDAAPVPQIGKQKPGEDEKPAEAETPQAEAEQQQAEPQETPEQPDPEAEPKPEPEPEPTGPVNGPKVTRRKVKVQKAA
jgi:hypothetical protein